MAETPRNPNAGGIFIAIGAIGGVVIGHLYGETSIGLLAGIAAGAAIALAMWFFDRGR